MTEFWYLSTPYSKHYAGLDAAYRMACEQMALCIKSNIKVFSPISHTHGAAILGGIDPLDHNIWLPADAPMMDAACGIIVVKAIGWQDSIGIAHEVALFERAGKPVIYMAVGRAPIAEVLEYETDSH